MVTPAPQPWRPGAPLVRCVCYAYGSTSYYSTRSHLMSTKTAYRLTTATDALTKLLPDAEAEIM
jgi:hypothetical protein